MAKVQKYPEYKLVFAVEEYAKAHTGKIRVKDLAEWATNNIQGLEGVTYKNFTRLSRIDGKDVRRECTKRLDEINQGRALEQDIKDNNILLTSSNPDKFLELNKSEKRQTIIETKKQMDLLMSRNKMLDQRNRVVETENISLKQQNEYLKERIENIKEAQKDIDSKIEYIFRIWNEVEQNDIIYRMGFEEAKITEKFIQKMYDSSINIKNLIYGENLIDNKKEKNKTEIIDMSNILKGMDF